MPRSSRRRNIYSDILFWMQNNNVYYTDPEKFSNNRSDYEKLHMQFSELLVHKYRELSTNGGEKSYT